MKVLIYATSKQGFQEGSALEEACVHYHQGDEVIYLHCGSIIGACNNCPLYNKAICKLCQRSMRLRAKKYLPEYTIHSVNEFYTDEIKGIVSRIDFPMNTAEQVRNISYMGIEIGYGAFSTYISLTRNMNPEMNNDVKRYLKSLLIQQIKLIHILMNVVESFNPDLIVFHNGRFAQYRPVLGVAKMRGIHYICTETFQLADGTALKNNFLDSIPHGLDACTREYESYWNNYANSEKKEKIGKMFFENRRFGRYSGDKIYIKSQQAGKIPEEWDERKENIVIFNSSEDEFCAINKEIDSFALFKSQIEGIKVIMEHYKNDQSKHFYLRIHPNLRDVPYSYHMDLYKLCYPNFSIISGDSPVSSYSILDKANKVIVFGSTMGIEATYWGKPVICLAYARYLKLNVVYKPNDVEQLWSLIDSELSPKNNYNALKYGFYYMSDEHESFRYIDNAVDSYFFRGKKYNFPRYCKLFGSTFLYCTLEAFYKAIMNSIWTKPFNRVPV